MVNRGLRGGEAGVLRMGEEGRGERGKGRRCGRKGEDKRGSRGGK